MVSSDVPPKDSYSRTEAAALLGLSTVRVTQLAQDGRLFKVSDDNADYWAEGKKLVLVEGKRQKGLPKGADEERVTLKPRGSAFPSSEGEAPALSADGKEPETFHNDTATSASAPTPAGTGDTSRNRQGDVDTPIDLRTTPTTDGPPDNPPTTRNGEHTLSEAANTDDETVSLTMATLRAIIADEVASAVARTREESATPPHAPLTATPVPATTPSEASVPVSAEDRVVVALCDWLAARGQ